MHEQLRPVLTLTDGLPYFKDNFFEKRWYKFALRGGLILVLTVAAYLPVLLVGNVLWIDDTEITHEQILRSSGGLGRLWCHPSIQPAYQPLAETTLWVEHQLWDWVAEKMGANNPSDPLALQVEAIGYHAVSIALHLANCMLVWFALRRLNVPGAWLAAAIFALHPLQVQAVAWVGGQPLLLGTFCYGVSLMLFLRFAQVEPAEQLDASIKLSEEWYQSHPEAPAMPVTMGSMPRAAYAFSLAIFLCAVLADPGSWSLPLMLLLILWWRGGHITTKDIKALVPYLVIGGLALIFSAVQTELYASRAKIAVLSAPDLVVGRILLPGRVLAYYLMKLIVPFPLSFSGPQWDVSAKNWWQYLFLIALIAAGVAIWRRREKIGKGPLVAIAFFVLNLIPVTGLTRFGWMRYSFVGNYLQYRACIGMIGLGVGGLMFWMARARSKDSEHLFRIVAAIVLLAPFCGLVVMQGFNYASASTLWAADVDVDPQSEVARLRLSSAYLQEKNFDKAIKQIEEAIKNNPRSVRLWIALGKAHEAAGEWVDAAEKYRTAIEIEPRNTKALSQLAAVQAHQKKTAEAIDTYLEVLRIDPDDAAAHDAIADLYYLGLKDFDTALRHRRRAVGIDPNSALYHLNFARLLFAEGQKRKDSDLFRQAAEQLQDAAKADPNNFDTYMTAGEMLSQLGDFVRAERMYHDATHVRKNSFEAWNNLGVALAAQGRLDESIYCFEKALQINPDFYPARKNLAAAKWGKSHPNPHPVDTQPAHAQASGG